MNKQEIIGKVKSNGFYFHEGFFSTEEVKSIKSELNSLYDSIPDSAVLYDLNKVEEKGYEYGKAMRFSSLGLIPKFRDIYLSKNFSEITKSYLGNNCQENLQTFSSYEYKTYTENITKPRNSYWHFDPWRALKYFIYLDDVDLSNGCLRIIPNTITLSQKIRSENSFEDVVNKYYAVEEYIPDLENDIINLEGKSGSLIIFDTELFHVGSNILDSERERMIITVHNRS